MNKTYTANFPGVRHTYPATDEAIAVAASLNQRRRELRYALITIGVSLAALCVIVVLAVTAGLPSLFGSGASSPATIPASPAEPRIGNIVFEPTADRCRQLSFDNDTGSIAETIRSCDHKGSPGPAGTIRRLNAISKSFSGQ